MQVQYSLLDIVLCISGRGLTQAGVSEWLGWRICALSLVRVTGKGLLSGAP